MSSWQTFVGRHIGLTDDDRRKMSDVLGVQGAGEILRQTVPEEVWALSSTELPQALSEHEALALLRSYVQEHWCWRNYIGMGYFPTITPAPVQRYLFENPGWYTPYTPYQAEISQGRLELLFYFQTLTTELTGLDLAAASLLDEGTAAAEALGLSLAVQKRSGRRVYFASATLHPQTLVVLGSRARARGVRLWVADVGEFMASDEEVIGGMVQYPHSFGGVEDYGDFTAKLHAQGALAACATDLLALTLLKSPGEMGFDMAFGSTQRLGVPMGFGGPHAAFFTTRMAYKRQMPGRVVGRSRDRDGKRAYRLALQTREQHIRRERATSNICTAQSLLACMATAYAIYHGKEGLQEMARDIWCKTQVLARALQSRGLQLRESLFFETCYVCVSSQEQRHEILQRCGEHGINVRETEPLDLGVSLGEGVGVADVAAVIYAFSGEEYSAERVEQELAVIQAGAGALEGFQGLQRQGPYLDQEVFSQRKSELSFLRYIKGLENKDLSLVHAMIPLGSCTMKLNAASELQPLSWPELAHCHPYQDPAQVPGWMRVLEELSGFLCALTGLAAVSLQPNSGAQGELAGLMTMARYHRAQRGPGETLRDLCLVPASAHGTNPASAVLAGFSVVVVPCDGEGNVDLQALKHILEQHGDRVCGLMMTYPSTHGVYELEVRTICDLIHDAGGLVYLDGANLNAQLEVCRPGDYGVDVCHMNLHKTFCIPHGGGGPGAGPIAVASHLVPYLPQDPLSLAYGQGRDDAQQRQVDEDAFAVSSCHYGSPLILPISWMYIMMMGSSGLRAATEAAVLSANYVAQRLRSHYPLLYTGRGGWVAHECLLDLRGLTKGSGITVEDVAKRLMDYGFHAPTMSFPLPGTLMIEPTESESLQELDRFVDAMISIREEIRRVERGEWSRDHNPLKNAPHPWSDLMAKDWPYPYSREVACAPAPWVQERKFWPACARIDNAHGDRQLICACAPTESYQ